MSNAIKILVVDDEQVIIDSVVRLCSAEGLAVDTALDVNIAFEKLERHTYHLIITDIMMPEVDGFHFLSRLREYHISTPVIITTGFSTVENAVRSLTEGAIDFLPKPFTVDELLSCVQRGLKFGQIKSQKSSGTDQGAGDDFVPCPYPYFRLGYHTWAALDEDGSIKIGLTDLFLKTIASIKRIEFFGIDEEIIQGTTCAQIETENELIHNILAPMSGRILERNEKIIEKYDLIEKDPYFEGWIYRLIPSDLDYEIKHLIPCSSDR